MEKNRETREFQTRAKNCHPQPDGGLCEVSNCDLMASVSRSWTERAEKGLLHQGCAAFSGTGMLCRGNEVCVYIQRKMSPETWVLSRQKELLIVLKFSIFFWGWNNEMGR